MPVAHPSKDEFIKSLQALDEKTDGLHPLRVEKYRTLGTYCQEIIKILNSSPNNVALILALAHFINEHKDGFKDILKLSSEFKSLVQDIYISYLMDAKAENEAGLVAHSTLLADMWAHLDLVPERFPTIAVLVADTPMAGAGGGAADLIVTASPAIAPPFLVAAGGAGEGGVASSVGVAPTTFAPGSKGADAADSAASAVPIYTAH